MADEPRLQSGGWPVSRCWRAFVKDEEAATFKLILEGLEGKDWKPCACGSGGQESSSSANSRKTRRIRAVNCSQTFAPRSTFTTSFSRRTADVHSRRRGHREKSRTQAHDAIRALNSPPKPQRGGRCGSLAGRRRDSVLDGELRKTGVALNPLPAARGHWHRSALAGESFSAAPHSPLRVKAGWVRCR